MDIPWPRGTLVVAVRRDAESLEPAGDTVLMRGDHLTVLVPRDLADSLADALEREAAAHHPPPPAGEQEA